MNAPPRVLLVGSTAALTRALARTLRSAGFAPKTVGDFAAAKEILSTCPELLITELKLGAFNGLHLAIRAGVQGTPTIVIGEPDPVLEAEANKHHAKYLTLPIDPARMLTVAQELLTTLLHTRRSPRKQVPVLDAFVNGVPARVVDVSYEGMRLEWAEAALGPLPESFKIRLPLFNFSCDVQRVWTSPRDGDSQGSSSVACGAALSTVDAEMGVVWRDLVDALPGLALTD